MCEIKQFARKDCPVCFGRGVVRVPGKWHTTALCHCLNGWPAKATKPRQVSP
jgi:hypothetical protein